MITQEINLPTAAPVSHYIFLNQGEYILEQQLREAIGIFQNLPEEILRKPAADGGWSIAECFTHLNSYAAYYHPRIKTALAKAPVVDDSQIFKYSLLGQYFISLMDPARNKKKFKAVKKHRPVAIARGSEAIAIFIEHLEDLLSMLKLAKEKDLRRKTVSVSIAPLLKISIGDTIVFQLTHNRRHLEQAKRNLAV